MSSNRVSEGCQVHQHNSLCYKCTMTVTSAACCSLSAGIIEGPYAFSIITLLLNFVLFLLSTVLLAK